MPPSSRHILAPFDTALDALRNRIFFMTGLVERSLRNAQEGLLLRDVAACNRVIADDAEIDGLEVGIDQDGISLLVRFQPVAGDMRRVIAAMKLGSHLERIADQATSIARRARKLNDMEQLPETALIGPMFEFTITLLKDSLAALSDEKTQEAMAVKQRDRELDRMNREFGARITTLMASRPQHAEAFVHLLFIAGSLERIGDYAKNIAEETFFMVSAEDIRHSAPPVEGGGGI